MIDIKDISRLYPDRVEVKKSILEKQQYLEDLTGQLELAKAKLWDGHTFVSTKSDLKARGYEFTILCNQDVEVSGLDKSIKQTKSELRFLENTLSEINFEHRQKMIDGMTTVAGMVNRFTDAVKLFDDAVTKLVESRKK
jgi:hypothetical protein